MDKKIIILCLICISAMIGLACSFFYNLGQDNPKKVNVIVGYDYNKTKTITITKDSSFRVPCNTTALSLK